MVSAPVTPTGGGPLSAVVIGGSAGSIPVLGEILPALPADFAPVLVVVHLLPTSPSRLTELFAPRCAMRVREAVSGDPIERGTIYFAPPDYHLLVERDSRCALSIEAPIHFSRPAIDVLFLSAAEAYASCLVAVVLTGASTDGADGARAVEVAGGRVIVQAPETADVETMPRAALGATTSARAIPRADLARALVEVIARIERTHEG